MTGFERGGADSVLGVQTPEGIEYVLHPAGLPVRACAWAIDSFIQGSLLIVLLITAGIHRWILGRWFMLIVIFALDWFYHTAFEIFCKGQSPGKRLMGIRVVRGDGSPANPGASFLRNLMRFADTFMFLYLAAFLCMLASRGFRRIGDWTADTLVIYTSGALSPGRFISPALRQPGMPWLAEVPAVTPSRRLTFEEKQALLMFARRYPLLGNARSDEIAGIWTEELRSGGRGEAGYAEAHMPPSGASLYLLGIARTIGG